MQPLPATWLERGDIDRTTGWAWKAEGLCRDEVCMPLFRAEAMVDGNKLDVAAFWRNAGWPVVHDASSELWVLGESAAHRAGALKSLKAPDFELPDLDGNLHRLLDFRGRRVFLVTWASWCGCRADLPVWQSLYERANETPNKAGDGRGFTVLAVALDHADAAIATRAPGLAPSQGAKFKLSEQHH